MPEGPPVQEQTVNGLPRRIGGSATREKRSYPGHRAAGDSTSEARDVLTALASPERHPVESRQGPVHHRADMNKVAREALGNGRHAGPAHRDEPILDMLGRVRRRQEIDALTAIPHGTHAAENYRGYSPLRQRGEVLHARRERRNLLPQETDGELQQVEQAHADRATQLARQTEQLSAEIMGPVNRELTGITSSLRTETAADPRDNITAQPGIAENTVHHEARDILRTGLDKAFTWMRRVGSRREPRNPGK